MSYYAHKREKETGKVVTKRPITADEAEDLTDESTIEYCCPGEVDGKRCGATFENHVCAKESPRKITPYFRPMKGVLHIKDCPYQKKSKVFDWKAESTKNTARISFKQIIDFLQKKGDSKKKKPKKVQNNQKWKQLPALKEIKAQIPSEYWDNEAQECKENYNCKVFKNDNGSIVDVIVRDSNTGEEKWSYSNDYVEKDKKQLKKTKKKHGEIEKNALQLYRVAANADEETNSLTGEIILDISVNSSSFMDFRKGKRKLNGPGIFVARRYNPSDDIRRWIKGNLKNRTIDVDKSLLFYDAFLPDGSNNYDKKTEDYPLIALVECDTNVTRELVLDLITSTNKINRNGKRINGPYFVIACYWESADIKIQGISRKVVIGKIFHKDQLVQIPDNDIKEEDKERFAAKGNVPWPGN